MQCVLQSFVARAPSNAKSEQLSLDTMRFVSISIHVGIIREIPEQIELQGVQLLPYNCQLYLGIASVVILYEYIILDGNNRPTDNTWKFIFKLIVILDK